MLDDPLQSLATTSTSSDLSTRSGAPRLSVNCSCRHMTPDSPVSSNASCDQVGDDGATSVYLFEGWSPEGGPVLKPSEVAGEPEEIRVAAA